MLDLFRRRREPSICQIGRFGRRTRILMPCEASSLVPSWNLSLPVRTMKGSVVKIGKLHGLLPREAMILLEQLKSTAL